MHSEIVFKDRQELFNMDGKGCRVIEPHYEEYICLDDDEIDVDLLIMYWEAILNYDPYWYHCSPPDAELIALIKWRILRAGWTLDEFYEANESQPLYKIRKTTWEDNLKLKEQFQNQGKNGMLLYKN